MTVAERFRRAMVPSARSAHPVDVGLRAEAAVTSELLRRGIAVLQPYGSNQRYDLVLDLGGTFVTVQIKSGRLRRGCAVFKTSSVQSNRTGSVTRGYGDEVDLFVVYCTDSNRTYAVPVAEAPSGEMRLRVHPACNGQSRGVHWARDYELPT